MEKRILITGGAGFIGGHLTDALLALGHSVRVLDLLHPQVHGPGRTRPAYLDSRAELIVGDIRDPNAVRIALKGIDVVVHCAARVGVGQSMYETREYMDVNSVGTAVLLEASSSNPLKSKLVRQNSIWGFMLRPNLTCSVLSTDNDVKDNVLINNPTGIFVISQPGNTFKGNTISATPIPRP